MDLFFYKVLDWINTINNLLSLNMNIAMTDLYLQNICISLNSGY